MKFMKILHLFYVIDFDEYNSFYGAVTQHMPL